MDPAPPSLLLIDDDDATRSFLAENLSADGFKVAMATAAGEGVRAIEWRRVGREVDLGVPSRVALGRMVGRLPVSEVSALVAALDRAARHGAPLADTLRAQARGGAALPSAADPGGGGEGGSEDPARRRPAARPLRAAPGRRRPRRRAPQRTGRGECRVTPRGRPAGARRRRGRGPSGFARSAPASNG